MAKILIVEDDQFTRELYQSFLKDVGHEVDVAADGESGLTEMVKGGYDLVLLDIMLPGRDGISILKEMKTIKLKNPNKKIVMLTVLDQDEFVKSAFRLGADGYLIKSALTPDGVVTEVQALLEKEA